MKNIMKIAEEVVEVSNYTNKEDVIQAIADGDIEIYLNQTDYSNQGFDLENTDIYSVLSTGVVAHFLHG